MGSSLAQMPLVLIVERSNGCRRRLVLVGECTVCGLAPPREMPAPPGASRARSSVPRPRPRRCGTLTNSNPSRFPIEGDEERAAICRVVEPNSPRNPGPSHCQTRAIRLNEARMPGTIVLEPFLLLKETLCDPLSGLRNWPIGFRCCGGRPMKPRWLCGVSGGTDDDDDASASVPGIRAQLQWRDSVSPPLLLADDGSGEHLLSVAVPTFRCRTLTMRLLATCISN